MARYKSVCFLHGLGSSPEGTKAQYFREHFLRSEVPYDAPDLNTPDFTRQTVTAQLGLLSQVMATLPKPVLLMGSSLGGWLAIRYSMLHPDELAGVVLVAPVTRFNPEGLARLTGSSMEQWRLEGAIPFMMDGWPQPQLLGFDLVLDAPAHEVHEAVLEVPVLALHGTADPLIPWEDTDRFVGQQRHGTCSLLLNCDHTLNNRLDVIAELMANWEAKAPMRR